MEAFYEVFSDTLPGDMEQELRIQALKFWSLLVIKNVSNLNVEHLKTIMKLFISGCPHLSIASGEAIALIFEKNEISSIDIFARKYSISDQDFEILKAIMNQKPPNYFKEVHGTKLNINSWSCKCQYDAFTYILGCGMRAHLDNNPILRTIFNLGLSTNATHKKKQQMEALSDFESDIRASIMFEKSRQFEKNLLENPESSVLRVPVKDLISKFDTSDVVKCICKGEAFSCTSQYAYHTSHRKLFNSMKNVFDPNTKAKSLEKMSEIFRVEYIFKELFLDKANSLLDIFVHVLKGNNQEITSLVEMSACLAITLGARGKFILSQLKSHLLEWLTDSSKPTLLRTKCVAALGIFGFLTSNDETEAKSFMEAFYQVFKEAEEKILLGELNTNEEQFHVQALKFWTLLAIKYSPNLRINHIEEIDWILKCENNEMRKAAGEAIAVFYEMDKKAPEEKKFWAYLVEIMINSRDLENIEAPDYVMEEYGIKLNITSWRRKCQYDAFTYILGCGMRAHLDKNCNFLISHFIRFKILLKRQNANLEFYE